ncbi:conjugal transfer protein TraK [Robiginitalea sp. M366]|uniref:conjugal transfer protein TraK n=1 Tax=Robiginitalea aestuariiviva TaxID=3036903 RepID=UPI00240D5871|nr:conjugal transfer protein TraK [Robiginitalea aestuariiviva]MDG1573299.1 conjugal transfer protein TraK [Robiginitalea aestuariiviva]
MKFTYSNIHTLFRINRLIVISVVLVAFASSSFSGWLAYEIHREALDNAFAIDPQGEVHTLTRTASDTNREVEALAHLEAFHRLFYGIDGATFEDHLERALWWGDASVNELYREKKADGLYNRLLQYSLTQRVLEVDSRIELGDSRIPFTTRIRFEVQRASVTDTYELITTGVLVVTERNFPHNPHGMLITNFFEQSLKQLPHENP